MNVEDLEHLESRFPAIRAAARRYAQKGQDPDDIASEIVMQATRLKAPVRETLADKNLKRRVIDAQRTLYMLKPNEVERPMLDGFDPVAPEQDFEDDEERFQLAQWLSETVDSGEPIRREVAAREALGCLPVTISERLRIIARWQHVWPSGNGIRSRAQLIERKRLREQG